MGQNGFGRHGLRAYLQANRIERRKRIDCFSKSNKLN